MIKNRVNTFERRWVLSAGSVSGDLPRATCMTLFFPMKNLYTEKTQKEVQKFVDEHKEPDFAKAGQKATFTVFLKKGVEALDAYGHGMEAYLRQLGLPTKLNMQKIELLADTYVCREGEELNVE